MADFVLSADQVGQVITYVAPGFLAQAGYRALYPSADRPLGHVLIMSVVFSLPLVAIANAAISDPHRPSRLGYALALTVGSFLAGYLVAGVRGKPMTKKVLGRFGYHIEPDGSIYAQTVRLLSDEAEVLVELKDGRRVKGTPRNGPQHEGDGIRELYLTHPRAEGDRDRWHRAGAGIIVPLSEVSNIVLSEDPTGAPPAPPEDEFRTDPAASRSGNGSGETPVPGWVEARREKLEEDGTARPAS